MGFEPLPPKKAFWFLPGLQSTNPLFFPSVPRWEFCNERDDCAISVYTGR